ncbi:hypothetical protein B0T24DRAFT_432318 [Lasiosphaeria ovina]|uniref:Uncharacterized protein n=1 Tax=Lasiosphaeria ovina TaxID=92902 RepID=A0AAE0MZP7_9PEZI|nr:hypothetical protein B0T24DRAFT_432318 [Lasiosphaeria ovina]
MRNGKEEACIDVQHRKRGRPWLRDDREAKFDSPRFRSGSDPLRRPMVQPLYGPGPSMGLAYDDNLRRTQSYRVLKSQPAESVAPGFPDRALTSDANIFPAPLSISSRAPDLRISEAAAFLTIDFEFGNALSAFLDAVARPSAKGMRLVDLLAASGRDKVSELQRQI